MNKRVLLVITIISVGFLIVFLRLVELMLVNHEKFTKIAATQHSKGQEILVRRGSIYDRRDRELAVNLERPSLYCNPCLIESPEIIASNLQEIINEKRKKIMEKLGHNKQFVWIARKISPNQAISVRRLKLKGIGLLPDTERFYPKDILASHVLGFVNIDNYGMEGIEKRYEEYLTADGGTVVLKRDALGNIFSTGTEFESIGKNVVLTIDENLQYILESELEMAFEKWEPQAATAIMMDPHNGEILALSNRPTYDPNKPGSFAAAHRRNRAVTDLYEPGSTFKIIAAAAALEEGILRINSTIDCSQGMIIVGGKRISDHHKHGILTLKEVVQKSSNVGAVKVALKLGPELFYEYIKRFGFSKRTGIDLTGEAQGIIKPPERWSGTTIGAMAIGYEVLITPLQILSAYAAIANGGYRINPHVVSKIFSQEGHIILKRGEYNRERIISEETASMLRDALISVTDVEGTAHKASIDGNTVAGKTGTAQMVDSVTGKYSHENFVSSFVGFVPANNPVFAIIVVLWKPKYQYYGGEVAAPVFSAIAEKALSYMFIPREDKEKDDILVLYKHHSTRI